MKTVIKVCIFTFLLAFVGTFILAFSFINIFYDFELVSANVLLYTSLIVASIISIFFVIVVIVLIKSEKKTKMEHWLSTPMKQHSPLTVLRLTPLKALWIHVYGKPLKAHTTTVFTRQPQ